MSKISLNSFQAQEAMVKRQRQMSTLTSLLIALLTLALLLIILAFVLLPSFMKEEHVLVSYNAPVDPEQQIQQKTVSMQRSKPSAPSSASAKVIAANTVSPTAIPVPDVEVTEPSLDFGIGDDFGDGWGNGSGDGMGGGGTTFFRQQVSAQRICYVIDYSGSMKGARDKLMRKELTKSVEQLGVGLQFQLIFFAGPAWVAGSDVSMAKDKKTAQIKLDGKSFKWKSPGGAYNWDSVGTKQKPEWISGGPGTRQEALKQVKGSPLIWGTNWENPLEMALEMDPAPQIIFFMTDGAVGGDMVKLAKRLGHRAKTKGTVINTVAMMQPKAEAAMKELAKRTGGQFTIVKENGKVELVPIN